MARDLDQVQEITTKALQVANHKAESYCVDLALLLVERFGGIFTLEKDRNSMAKNMARAVRSNLSDCFHDEGWRSCGPELL